MSGAHAAATRAATTTDAEMSELRAQLAKKDADIAAERQQRVAAERGRNAAQQRVASEVDQRFAAEESAIENGLAAASADAERLESEVAALQEEGKFTEATKKQRELAAAQYKIEKYEDAKGQIAHAKTTAKTEQEERTRDPLAAYGPPGSPTRRWIDAHPRFMTDEAYRKSVEQAHWKARGEGLQVESADYFKFIEGAVDAPARREAPRRDAERPEDDADGGRVLSDAAELEDADGPVIEEEDPELVELEPEGEDLYEDAIRGAQDRGRAARERVENGGERPERTERERPARSERERRPERPSRAGGAAPPSRSSGAGGRGAGAPRMTLTPAEAEVALSSYPVGDPDYPEIKTRADSFKAYWDEKQRLVRERRIGPDAPRV